MNQGQSNPSALILYQTEDGRTRIECRFEDQTLWLTQIQLAELFQTSVPNINIHLKAIYDEAELVSEATVKSRLIVQTEGTREVSRPVLHYAPSRPSSPSASASDPPGAPSSASGPPPG